MLDKNMVVTAFIFVTGVGSCVGVVLGPYLIDKYGGYSDDAGKYRSLVILVRMTLVGALAAGLASFAVSWRMSSDKVPVDTPSDLWLWIVWVSVAIIFAALSATIATHTAINIESASKEMRSFAAGVILNAELSRLRWWGPPTRGVHGYLLRRPCRVGECRGKAAL